MQKVFVLKTRNRAKAIPRLFAQFDLRDLKRKRIALKANYNSADPFPASTHLDTLRAIVKELRTAGAEDVTLAERSGMDVTRQVLAETGVLKLAEEMRFKTEALDEVDKSRWIRFPPSSNFHWQHGFHVAKVFKDADIVVQTCCLKTHRFGGHFTMSLKNSIGLIAKHVSGEDYDYMEELHSSTHQRDMIAEVNFAYKADVVIMDGIEAFVSGGPERGDQVNSEVMLAGRDRVAIDAVGVAILRHFGTTNEVGEGRIFEQKQIMSAAELGIGIRSAYEIELAPLDAESHKFAEKISKILADG